MLALLLRLTYETSRTARTVKSTRVRWHLGAPLVNPGDRARVWSHWCLYALLIGCSVSWSETSISTLVMNLVTAVLLWCICSTFMEPRNSNIWPQEAWQVWILTNNDKIFKIACCMWVKQQLQPTWRCRAFVCVFACAVLRGQFVLPKKTIWQGLATKTHNQSNDHVNVNVQIHIIWQIIK